MVDVILTAVAYMIGAWAVIVGVAVLLLPVYLCVRHRDAMAELDAELERQYGPISRAGQSPVKRSRLP